MEQYRSGHNEPDSKSGSPKGPVGSNPTCSAKRNALCRKGKERFTLTDFRFPRLSKTLH